MNKIKERKKKIFNKILAGQIILGFVIIFALNLILGFSYFESKIDDVNSVAFSYVKSISRFIDSDKAVSYLDTLKKDDYYYNVQKSLDIIKENSNIKYLYVGVLKDNQIYYIWDTTANGVCFDLGEHENMSENGNEIVEKSFNNNPIETISYSETEDWGVLASAYYPLFDSNNKPVALVGVDVPIQDIIYEILQYITLSSLAVAIIIVAFCIVYFMLMNKVIIVPITKLKNASKKIINDNSGIQKVNIDIYSKDELDDLARSIEFMSEEMKEYTEKLVKMTSEKERITAELEVATKIQSNMLPSTFPPYPDQSVFDIYATMNPAKEVGGDFYDFFMIDNKHVGLVIADVSGKGVPAALFMVKAKNLIKDRAVSGDDPGKVLKDVNNELCNNNEEGFFVTCWFAVFDLENGELVSANAGHEHPALKNKDGEFELKKYKHSLPLAAMENMEFKINKTMLSKGDRLFVYTDGVTEATNTSNEQFGEDRMLASLNKNSDEKSSVLLNNLREDIKTFSSGQEQFDDITMLCFDYFG